MGFVSLQVHIMLLVVTTQCTYAFGLHDAVSNQTATAYSAGVKLGIINPEKYPLEAFIQDEKNIFKDLYSEFISMNFSNPLDYEEWLIFNNFGILPDTQESLFQKKSSKRSCCDEYSRGFYKTVKKGDILISSLSKGGLMGHAAIMTSDYWVLEMAGGKKWKKGIKNNNRQLAKDEWYDEYYEGTTYVYRCPEKSVAQLAAIWADHNYFNPNGGEDKVIKIKYKITTDLHEINPSYSSKLIFQAYYYGPYECDVIQDVDDMVIVPTNIPALFRPKFALRLKGKY